MLDSNKISRRLDELDVKAQDFAAMANSILREVNNLSLAGNSVNLTDLRNELANATISICYCNEEYRSLDTLINIARFALPKGCDPDILKTSFRQELNFIRDIYINPFVSLYHAVNNTFKRADIVVAISRRVGGDELVVALLAFSDTAKSNIPRNRL